ncbi:MAG: L-serine ammonia-lyase, iron-sulfur-dependent, subunit alpha [Firmicutes bacterium]|nr:L-serine ammonia-lyase, iron-sulfur-dependent, subunit alpha [Bacillota bacterium]
MRSIKGIYNIGIGSSSSHTLGPYKAAKEFAKSFSEEDKVMKFEVTLFNSLALTGEGHFTDRAVVMGLTDVFSGLTEDDIIFHWIASEQTLHANTLMLQGFDDSGNMLGEETYFSTGGGAIERLCKKTKMGIKEGEDIYGEVFSDGISMNKILHYCKKNDLTLIHFIEEFENNDLYDHLKDAWRVMSDAIREGLSSTNELVLESDPKIAKRHFNYFRRAKRMFEKAEMLKELDSSLHDSGTLSAYALAVAEQNASRGAVVTSPTLGACGVLPAVLRFAKEKLHIHDEQRILEALAIAGLIGNIAKTNATISGAIAGCQAEIGVAASMASSAYCYLQGGTNYQIEHAAEIALKHALGLTCDPVEGFVMLPCIERNAIFANQAISSAHYALLMNGAHTTTYDFVLDTMKRTGEAMCEYYKETAKGGLAVLKSDDVHKMQRENIDKKTKEVRRYLL